MMDNDPTLPAILGGKGHEGSAIGVAYVTLGHPFNEPVEVNSFEELERAVDEFNARVSFASLPEPERETSLAIAKSKDCR